MAKWVCTVCGYVYEGENPPAECPVCHVGADKFKKVEGDLTLAAEHEFGVYASTVKNNPEISDEDKKYIFEQLKANFDGEVSKMATSILRETGRLISRAELSAAMIEELDALYTALRSGETSGYLDEYRRRCVTIGREVQLLWQDTKEKVTALDVDEEFGLIVRRENGTVETVRTGEVSVRGLYGYVE